MVGRIFGTTGQLKYKINSGQKNEQNIAAEDMKGSTEERVFVKSCAFFVA